MFMDILTYILTWTYAYNIILCYPRNQYTISYKGLILIVSWIKYHSGVKSLKASDYAISIGKKEQPIF